MADERRPHFVIPEGLVRNEPVRRTGRSETFPRADFGAHGERLVGRVRSLREASAAYRDSELTQSMYFQVTAPPTVAIRNEK